MNAWIFDVDGVLSNLETRDITEPSLFPFLKKILLQGDLLAFNTGRDTVWVRRHILEPLEKMGVEFSLLKDVFLACEKGGTWQEADKDVYIHESFVLPSLFVEKVKKIIDDEFADVVFFDISKKTMISIEMRKGISLDVFTPRQRQLHDILARLLEENNLLDNYFIQEDLIATDIIHKNAGKDMGMQHIVTWLQTIGKIPEHFYCFGDNPSDLHMGELLSDQNFPFTFVYVGTKPLQQPSFAPLIPKEKFDKGTTETLKQLL